MFTHSLVDGYCDTTGFNNAGACENDDKGSFAVSFSHATTWASAAATCAALCLKCTRCRFVSLSTHWNDCSWFNKCDLNNLHRDIQGHRSMRVK